MVSSKVTWFGGKQFVGIDSSKHSVVISSQDEANGTGMRPLDMLLVALGGCTAMGVVDILQRKRQEVSGFEINLSGEQEDDPPRFFNHIHIEYIAKGRGIKEKALTDAIELSLEKYCSVSATIKGKAKITTSYQIVEV
jgi:putative redox protein